MIGRDPLEALTRSTYGYVNNNPLNRIDPNTLVCDASLLGIEPIES